MSLLFLRRYIPLSGTRTIATALICSILDYYNFLLYNTSTCPKLFGKGNHAFSSFFLIHCRFWNHCIGSVCTIALF